MNKKNLDGMLLISYIIVWLLFLLAARLMAGCSEANQIRKTQKEMRGDTRHKWKGGPHRQNRMFTGYQY